MKYFLDTEFLEGPQRKRFFGIPTIALRFDKNDCLEIYRPYTPNTIDLISIGIVAEDGREYYAVSKDFNLKEAWNRFDLKIDDDNFGLYTKRVYWIRENVLKPIWIELSKIEYGFCNSEKINFSYKNLKKLIDKHGKSNGWIENDIMQFTLDPLNKVYCGWIGSLEEYFNILKNQSIIKPEFYAYFADYDWVVFCWLFGKMMDLPKGFPMYCKDLKQMLDEKAKKHIKPYCFGDTEIEIDDMAERSIKGQVESFKTFSNYPKQDPSKSHNSIEDARWNKQLYDFLNKL